MHSRRAVHQKKRQGRERSASSEPSRDSCNGGKRRVRNRKGESDGWFGEKHRGGMRKKCPGKGERRGGRSQGGNTRKTLARVEKKKNREDGCMITRMINAIGKDDQKGAREKKNHTFE